MPDNSSNNKRIAKNTMLLYFRMLFSMFVSFYTSRVVLQTLGVVDYGIYNVVGGVVSMFTLISNAMNVSTQRYITFALGKQNFRYLQSIFSNSVFTHILIAAIILVLSETLGLWFLYNKLVIPAERMNAAFWVLQCSLATICISIISVPYNALVIAHERMSAFAYISILEVLIKLAIALIISFDGFDRLVLYSILLLCLQAFLRFLYGQYCLRNFPETKIVFKWNFKLFKEMTSFASWNMMGTIAGMLYTQGVNMVLNMFFGPIINAARAIAIQVQGAITQLASNFQMAINPQITKTYANTELTRMHTLIFKSSKYSYLLLSFMIIPLMLETPAILNFWLKDTPDWSVSFIRIISIIVIFDALSNPLMISVQATGNVKFYQVVVSSILLMILPFSYVILKIGASPTSVFICQLVFTVLAYIARLLIIRNRINLSLTTFFKEVFIRCFLFTAFALPIPLIIKFYSSIGASSIVTILITLLCICLSVFFFGLDKQEKTFLANNMHRLKNGIIKNH